MSDATNYPVLYRVSVATELRQAPGPAEKAMRGLPADQVLVLVGEPGLAWLEVEAPGGQRGFAPAAMLRRQVEGAKAPQ
ncbi:MAG: SH3 domain-containing protein, partial [Gemmatimonadaceae bacterium]|nr:SH3 domain-containing protein [Acetobacteraceae bacterium]